MEIPKHDNYDFMLFLSKIEMTGKLKNGVDFKPEEYRNDRVSTTIDRQLHKALFFYAKSKDIRTGEMIDLFLKHVISEMIKGEFIIE